MTPFRIFAFAVMALATGCSYPSRDFMPTLDATDPRGGDAAARPAGDDAKSDQAQAPAPTAGQPAATPSSPSASGSFASTTGIAARGGAVSASTLGEGPQSKVAALRGDLRRLQNDVAQHNAELQRLRRQLDETQAAQDRLLDGIETRLKSTTVPNDPQLSGDLSQAQTTIVHASQAMARLNNIASWGTSDAALASYLQQAVHAATGDPDVSEADRKQLARLEIDAGRASAAVDQLVTQASGEIANRSLYLAGANRRIVAIAPQVTAAGQRAARAPVPAAASGRAVAGANDASGRRALVTIHFDRPNVAYEDQLFSAVKQALDRRPEAAFDVVAVAPPGQGVGNTAAAERNVESVVRSLGTMGLPPDRIRLSAATLADATGNEVRIYVR